MAQALLRADAKGSPAVLRRLFGLLPADAAWRRACDAGKEEGR